MLHYIKVPGNMIVTTDDVMKYDRFDDYRIIGYVTSLMVLNDEG